MLVRLTEEVLVGLSALWTGGVVFTRDRTDFGRIREIQTFGLGVY
jgi:hypothetical protein